MITAIAVTITIIIMIMFMTIIIKVTICSLMRAEAEPPECPVIETQHRDSSFQGNIIIKIIMKIS